MICTLSTNSWNGPFSSSEQQSVLTSLEKGAVIHLPQLPFRFYPSEQDFLNPQVLETNAKNISFNPVEGKLKRSRYQGEKAVGLSALMVRFAYNARQLLDALIPQYQTALITGRTSFRPAEIKGRKTSLLKDDTRLHVDAFPATPNHGKRILRVFTNVNPEGQSRHWQLGEPFEEVVQRFLPKLRNPIWGARTLLARFKLTKSFRTLYDHYMLMLHNQMKLDDHYQKTVEKKDVHFYPGETWIVMTDRVSHAALSGQYVLEQTFYLPPQAMNKPEHSPLYILEKVLNKKLV